MNLRKKRVGHTISLRNGFWHSSIWSSYNIIFCQSPSTIRYLSLSIFLPAKINAPGFYFNQSYFVSISLFFDHLHGLQFFSLSHFLQGSGMLFIAHWVMISRKIDSLGGSTFSCLTTDTMVVAPCHIILCPLTSFHCHIFMSSPWMNKVKVTRFSFCSFSFSRRDSGNASRSMSNDFFQKIDSLRAISEGRMCGNTS